MPLSVVAIASARLMLIAAEPITPPPSPMTAPKSRSSSGRPRIEAAIFFVRSLPVTDVDASGSDRRLACLRTARAALLAASSDAGLGSSLVGDVLRSRLHPVRPGPSAEARRLTPNRAGADVA